MCAPLRVCKYAVVRNRGSRRRLFGVLIIVRNSATRLDASRRSSRVAWRWKYKRGLSISINAVDDVADNSVGENSSPCTAQRQPVAGRIIAHFQCDPRVTGKALRWSISILSASLMGKIRCCIIVRSSTSCKRALQTYSSTFTVYRSPCLLCLCRSVPFTARWTIWVGSSFPPLPSSPPELELRNREVQKAKARSACLVDNQPVFIEYLLPDLLNYSSSSPASDPR